LLAFFVILVFAKLDYIFNATELLYEFMGLDGADTLDFRGIVTSAENAHIDELFKCKFQILRYPFLSDFGEGLFFVVEVSNHRDRSEN